MPASHNAAAEINEARNAQLAAAVKSLAGPDGVPYNGVMAVSVGPGATGKTSLRLAIQGQSLPEQRESTQGGDRQQLAARINHYSQMIDLVDIGTEESRVDSALVQLMLRRDKQQDDLRPIQKLADVLSAGDGHLAAQKRQQALAQREKDLMKEHIVDSGEAASAVASSASGKGLLSRAKLVVSKIADSPILRRRKPRSVPVPATPAHSDSSSLEELHFARDTDSVLSRLSALEEQGASEGVHINFFDMGGQPQFAPLVAPFLRE